MVDFYSMRMRAVRQHFSEEKRKRDELAVEKTFKHEDDIEFEQISKINDEWNRNVAEIREARLAKQRVDEEIRILEDIEQRKERQEEERRRINELVRKEKVR